MLYKNILTAVFVYLSMISTVYANSSYVLGQFGIQDRDGSQEYPFTGRIAAGYQWDTTLAFGDETSPKYLCLNYGLELGYQNAEKRRVSYGMGGGYINSITEYGKQLQSVDFLGTLDFYPTQRFELFAKLGPAFMLRHSTMSSVSSSYNHRFNESVEAWEYETTLVGKVMAGLGYDITSKINVNLAYARTFWSDYDCEESSFLAGVKYNFG